MWPRLISAAVGVWLMAAPAVLGFGGTAADNDRIAGPLIVMLSIVAISEVTRGVRWANLPLGVWLLLAPLALGFGTTATINSLATGLVVVLLVLPAGKISTQFGGGWRSLLGRWNERESPRRDRRSRA